MTRHGRDRNPADTARRKLADAQAKLQSAQEKRTRVLTQGELDVERARQKAATRLERATKEVERRAGKVARAEGRLLKHFRRSYTGDRGAVQNLEPEPTPSVEVVAEHLEAVQEQPAEDEIVVVVPSTDPPLTAPPTEEAQLVLDRYARQALLALNCDFPDGATFTDWLAATNIAKRTFLRTRRVLVDAGLVEHDGAGQGTRYSITPAGRAAIPDR